MQRGKTHVGGGRMTKRKCFRVKAHAGSSALTCGLVGSLLQMSWTFRTFYHAKMLIQLSPCGESVGVSETAARPWGNVHFIQLLFHVTELISAATLSESPQSSTVFIKVKDHKNKCSWVSRSGLFQLCSILVQGNPGEHLVFWSTPSCESIYIASSEIWYCCITTRKE